MPIAGTKDGAGLYFEESGNGEALVLVHEFGGDHRGWELQVRHLRERYRCVVFGARGYPPSDVPADPQVYSQELARDDVVAVMDHLGIGSAHLIGLSMVAFACLHVALAVPGRARSLILAACGWGATPGDEERFRAECAASAQTFETDIRAAAARHAEGPARVQLQRKDARRWNEFRERLALHSPAGAANTLRRVQMRRPILGTLVAQLRALEIPTLVIVGEPA
jgi:pimeloyl-ACP methyl ester carboxylesterase